MVGLALGALAPGLLVDLGSDPTHLVFWLLAALFALALPAVLSLPETVERDGGWRASLRPRVTVPRHLRAAFLAALPCMVATWALGGLVLSLGGSLTSGVLGEHGRLAAGLPIFLMAGTSAIASVRLRGMPTGTTVRGGLLALTAGMGIALAALALRSGALFLLGAIVAGLGFGPAFGAVFRLLTALAPAGERAALSSSILTVSYVAFSVPAIAAGAAVAQLGLRETADLYGVALVALALLALLLSGSLQEPDERPATAPVPGGALAECGEAGGG